MPNAYDFATKFVRAYPPQVAPQGPAVWLPFLDGKLVANSTTDSSATLFAADTDSPPPWVGADTVFLGQLDELACIGSTIADGGAPAHALVATLRDLYGVLSDQEYALATYASEILFWRRTSRYCPVCGSPTRDVQGDWGRVCTECGHTGYPRVSPAVLILIEDNGRILMGHQAGWGKRYSILAGFVESGESLEDCVRREANEEAGIEVAQVRYFGSQPWPYPHQLMIGFIAAYAGGKVEPQVQELDDVAWFTPSQMPDLPGRLSLSRQMIDWWLESQRK